MPNGFSKEERVAFENILEGFQDALVLSRNVAVFNTDQTTMERTNNIMWRPQPYIATSYSGTDMTTNFDDYTQLSVPATIGFQRSVPFVLTATELRDALQEGRLGDAAKQKLASDINVSVMSVAANQGTLFVKRSAAAAGFDDVALCEAIMNERGVQMEDRYLALSTRDYNGMASNLAVSTRSFGNSISDEALRAGFVGRVASFDTYKLDYANRKTAAAGGAGLTMSTLVAAGNYWVPKATSVATTGETSNVDNRYQTITISSTTNVAAGDAFTIANCNSVHLITKQDTGQPMTFRVISVPAGGTTLVISPPIISAQSGSDAEIQYQNCTFSATASNAAITFLNTVTNFMNPFWYKDSIEILPGRYAVPTDAGAAVMRAATDQGIELVMQKQYDINTMRTKYRLDTLYGVVNKQPMMTGVIMFSQT
jgi:hypothetical protein